MNDFDMGIVDVTSYIKPGDKSATINTKTVQDIFFLSSFVTSISTLKPVFSATNKTFKNLTRTDGTVRIGDVIEYSIVTSNTGSDTGINVKVTDRWVLPVRRGRARRRAVRLVQEPAVLVCRRPT